jgi:hypothetical protein
MSSIIRTVNGTHIVVENLDDIKHEFDNAEFVTLTEVIGSNTEWETQTPLWLNRSQIVSAAKLLESGAAFTVPPVAPLD